MKLCPYCGKPIVPMALTCKHCGEWLEDISYYLEKKGSVYAHTDSITLPPDNNLKKEDIHSQSKKTHCVFCDHPVVLSEKEKNDKEFTCSNCKKKNVVTNGQIDDVLKNVPVGWGWVLLTLYFAFAIQKYFETLDDILQVIITFSLSVFVLLFTYFVLRTYLLKERYEKKNFFGKIYNASIISGAVSLMGVVLFVFAFHFIYPFTGLQSDKNETNSKITYYKSKIDELVQKQNEIYDIISKSPGSKKEVNENIIHLDNYIRLKNEEKKYTDSIYITLGESSHYSGNDENKKKIKEAGLLMSKIITYKIMSAQNLKNFYIYGEKNSIKTVEELNKEIENLNKLYLKSFQDIFSVE